MIGLCSPWDVNTRKENTGQGKVGGSSGNDRTVLPWDVNTR